MTWMLMWFDVSVTTLYAMLQLLVLYRQMCASIINCVTLKSNPNFTIDNKDQDVEVSKGMMMIPIEQKPIYQCGEFVFSEGKHANSSI